MRKQEFIKAGVGPTSSSRSGAGLWAKGNSRQASEAAQSESRRSQPQGSFLVTSSDLGTAALCQARRPYLGRVQNRGVFYYPGSPAFCIDSEGVARVWLPGQTGRFLFPEECLALVKTSGSALLKHQGELQQQLLAIQSSAPEPLGSAPIQGEAACLDPI